MNRRQGGCERSDRGSSFGEPLAGEVLEGEFEPHLLPRGEWDDAALGFFERPWVGVVGRRLEAGDVAVGEARLVFPEGEAELMRESISPTARVKN